ncbi:MAG: mannose-1-phosphate guanylyltransferase [Candidatus Omnitrophota bacterium]|nr:MAG: mannose-1-phosphate guanylyltransferase [Candidatus Omnitrophota bacterium]
MSLYAVIIAGGRGKRFWPESRIERPKYLLRLPGGGSTLLQHTVSRLKGLVQSKNIIVVTNKLQYLSVKKQLPQINKKNIITEPLSRNTAAAVALAAAIINAKNPDGTMIVLPADQVLPIKHECKFRNALKTAANLAKSKDVLVTIGIKPTFPATGFGYIKAGKKLRVSIFKADKFIEKPNFKKAKAFIKNKNYLWNSGIFIMKTPVILKEIGKYMPGLAKGLRFIKGEADLNRYYKNLSDVSIDYGVMEKSKKVYVIKADIVWHDIGSWENLYKVIKPGPKGNIIIGPYTGVDTKDSIIIAKKKHLIGTIGLNGIVVIHTDNATLVCKKEKSELVKNLVDKIESKKALRRFL